MRDLKRPSSRIPARMMLAFGLAALMATPALSAPTPATTQSSRTSVASQGAAELAGGGVIAPPGSKYFKISPVRLVPMLGRWMVVRELFADLLAEAGIPRYAGPSMAGK